MPKAYKPKKERNQTAYRMARELDYQRDQFWAKLTKVPMTALFLFHPVTPDFVSAPNNIPLPFNQYFPPPAPPKPPSKEYLEKSAKLEEALRKEREHIKPSSSGTFGYLGKAGPMLETNSRRRERMDLQYQLYEQSRKH